MGDGGGIHHDMIEVNVVVVAAPAMEIGWTCGCPTNRLFVVSHDMPVVLTEILKCCMVVDTDIPRLLPVQNVVETLRRKGWRRSDVEQWCRPVAQRKEGSDAHADDDHAGAEDLPKALWKQRYCCVHYFSWCLSCDK